MAGRGCKIGTLGAERVVLGRIYDELGADGISRRKEIEKMVREKRRCGRTKGRGLEAEGGSTRGLPAL